MRRTKKLTAAFMAAVMAMTVFAGCGDSNTNTGTGKDAYVYNAPTGVEEAEIYIDAIDGISDDFMRGVDISSIISEDPDLAR